MNFCEVRVRIRMSESEPTGLWLIEIDIDSSENPCSEWGSRENHSNTLVVYVLFIRLLFE